MCLQEFILKFVKKNLCYFYADPITVLMECDEWLAISQQHYFEDVKTDLEKIIICENKLLDVYDYSVKAKTVKTNCYLPL